MKFNEEYKKFKKTLQNKQSEIDEQDECGCEVIVDQPSQSPSSECDNLPPTRVVNCGITTDVLKPLYQSPTQHDILGVFKRRHLKKKK